MNIISFQFLLFIIAVLLLTKISKSERTQNGILLAASLLFYGLGDYRFLLVLVAMSFLMWAIGLWIEKEHKKFSLVLGISLDLAALVFFKYRNFFISSFLGLLGMDTEIASILVPLGISIYSLKAISYIVDIYKGKIEAEHDIVRVMLYISFFPQITSGPIMKARDFLPQLNEYRDITGSEIESAVQLFALGLFKKVVIADRLAVCVNSVYRAPSYYSGISIILTIISYSLQLYYDFSGYSDMSIAVARALGFRVGKNFNLPYLSASPSEFWSRWNISLSSWLREYVYFPLGGSRKGKIRKAFNIIVTMLLSGLWHGASWAFIIWGGLLGVLSIVWTEPKQKTDSKPARFFKTVFLYLIISLLAIPFRVNNLNTVLVVIGRAFSLAPGITYIYVYSLIFIVLTILAEIYAVKRNGSDSFEIDFRLSSFKGKMLFILFLLVIAIFAYYGNSAFIYEGF